MSKLPLVGTTIFTVMSKLATEHNAINLSQGFPNFPVDEKLTEILKSIASESVHQYLPMEGYAPLMEKIGQTIKSSYNRSIETSTEFISVFLFVYSAMFGLTVGLFAVYMNNLISRNVTHNERLRAKWNQ
jgi:hypothetical protein